jgi:peroxiredoxin
MTLGLSLACSKEGSPPVEGSKAPDFAMNDLSGRATRLSDLRGKVVLIHFWATWCHYCLEEAPSLARLNAAMVGKNFQMITFALDKEGSAAVETYFRKAGLRLPTIQDPGGRVAKQYGVTGVPETFIVDGQGVIRKKFVGAREWDGPEMTGYLAEQMNR